MKFDWMDIAPYEQIRIVTAHPAFLGLTESEQYEARKKLCKH